MYILFINLGSKCDIFFLINLIIIAIKKIIQPMDSTQPNPTHMGWVGLGLTYVMGWIGLKKKFDPPWVKKSPQSDPYTPLLLPNNDGYVDLFLVGRPEHSIFHSIVFGFETRSLW